MRVQLFALSLVAVTIMTVDAATKPPPKEPYSRVMLRVADDNKDGRLSRFEAIRTRQVNHGLLDSLRVALDRTDFNKMDRNRDGFLTINELATRYDRPVSPQI